MQFMGGTVSAHKNIPTPTTYHYVLAAGVLAAGMLYYIAVYCIGGRGSASRASRDIGPIGPVAAVAPVGPIGPSSPLL